MPFIRIIPVLMARHLHRICPSHCICGHVCSVKYRHNGFTLIEILIAVALLSIVLTAIYSTYFLSYRALEGMDESLVKLQEARKAIDILRRELDSVYYKPEDKYTFLKMEDRDVYGKPATNLSFTSFAAVRPGLSRVAYMMQEQNKKLTLLKRVESPFSTEEITGIDIIEDLEAFAIEAKYQDKWVRTWDTEINKGLPEEIRISLSVLIKGRTVTLSDVSVPMYGKSL